jgi:23S rRNA pseudouridine1911/1915/1917 synthase
MSDQANARATMDWPVPPEQTGTRLDAFLRACLPHLSRREIDGALGDGSFSVNGHGARKGDRLKAGDRVDFAGCAALLADRPLAEFNLPIPVVYEDASILVVDKPAGIATHGFSGRDTGTLANYIAARHPALLGIGASRWEPGLVHRLDTETSGLVLVAKTQDAFERLRRQFRERHVEKIYQALVWGKCQAAGEIDLPLVHDPGDARRMRPAVRSSSAKIKSWNARTRYRRLAQSSEATLLEVAMESGVMHQIRVHLAAIGHPIVADPLYGKDRSETFGLTRHFLHARGLGFRHPENRRAVKFEAELPRELRAVLDQIGIKF